MFHFWRGERASQIASRITLSSACRDRVSENLSADAAKASRSLRPAACFNLAKYAKKFRGCDFCNGAVTDNGVGKAQKPPCLVQRGDGPSFALLLRDPFISNDSECVAGSYLSLQSLLFTPGTGINAGCELSFRRVSLFPCRSKSNGWINAQRQGATLSGMTVIDTPVTRAV